MKTPTEELAEIFERAWIPAQVFSALVDADYNEAFPDIPPEQRSRVPHIFSMLARKPKA